MFGLSFEKLVIIALVLAFVVGPERLPRYAEALRDGLARLRRALDEGRGRAQEELGVDLDPAALRAEWQRYDPRRIMREALAESPTGDAPQATPTSATDAPAPAALDPAVSPAPAVAIPAGRWVRVGGSSGHPQRRFVPDEVAAGHEEPALEEAAVQGSGGAPASSAYIAR